ncbi:hypothetical protein L914_01467 [Phytophthora nicotianae]|uniref:Uncharacterized protein n=1 Tax=Phytophthora nicotianae TaxID=4792 RepID=W2P3P6_PHYNI|nr:hypothetical protein L914_01467 [Phytophthora nicotianae]
MTILNHLKRWIPGTKANGLNKYRREAVRRQRKRDKSKAKRNRMREDIIAAGGLPNF